MIPIAVTAFTELKSALKAKILPVAALYLWYAMVCSTEEHFAWTKLPGQVEKDLIFSYVKTTLLDDQKDWGKRPLLLRHRQGPGFLMRLFFSPNSPVKRGH